MCSRSAPPARRRQAPTRRRGLPVALEEAWPWRRRLSDAKANYRIRPENKDSAPGARPPHRNPSACPIGQHTRTRVQLRSGTSMATPRWRGCPLLWANGEGSHAPQIRGGSWPPPTTWARRGGPAAAPGDHVSRGHPAERERAERATPGGALAGTRGWPAVQRTVVRPEREAINSLKSRPQVRRRTPPPRVPSKPTCGRQLHVP